MRTRVLVRGHTPDGYGGEPAEHAGRESDQRHGLKERRSRLEDQGHAGEADQERRQHAAVEREAEQQKAEDGHEDGCAEVEQHRLGQRQHADRVVVAEQRRHQGRAAHRHEARVRRPQRPGPVPDDPRREDREAQQVAPEEDLDAGKAFPRQLDRHAGEREHEPRRSHERGARKHAPAPGSGAGTGLPLGHGPRLDGGPGVFPAPPAHRRRCVPARGPRPEPAPGRTLRRRRRPGGEILRIVSPPRRPSVWNIAGKCVT